MANDGLPDALHLTVGAGPPAEVAVDQLLRHLPGRRLAFRSVLNGVPAFVKVFLDPGRGRRHAAREARRASRARGRHVPSPRLLHRAVARIGSTEAPALVYELLEGGHTLGDVLRARRPDDVRAAALEAVPALVEELALK